MTAHVQDKSTSLNTGSATTSLSLTSTPTLGDLIIVSSINFTNPSNVSSLSGFGVGSWTAVPGNKYNLSSGGYGQMEAWCGIVSGTPSGSGSVAFSATPSNGGAANVMECSGLSGSFDTSACTTANTTGANPSSPSVTPTNAGDFILLLAAFVNGSSSISAWTELSGFNSDLTGYADGAWKVPGSTSAQSATISTGGGAAFLVVSFLPPSPSYAPTMGWLAVLNSLAGTKNLGENLAANIYAYGSDHHNGLLQALNDKAGTKGLGLDLVCNKIAGTTGLSALNALNQAAGV